MPRKKMIGVLRKDLEQMTKTQLRDYTVALKTKKPATEMEQVMLQSALDMMCGDMPVWLNAEALEMVALVEYERATAGIDYFRETQELKKIYGGIR